MLVSKLGWGPYPEYDYSPIGIQEFRWEDGKMKKKRGKGSILKKEDKLVGLILGGETANFEMIQKRKESQKPPPPTLPQKPPPQIQKKNRDRTHNVHPKHCRGVNLNGRWRKKKRKRGEGLGCEHVEMRSKGGTEENRPQWGANVLFPRNKTERFSFPRKGKTG